MKKSSTLSLTITALFLALNIVLSLEIFSIPVPGGHLYLNDIVIVAGALLLNPAEAFAVGGIGAFLGDFFFYPAPMFVSLVTHGLQAVVISVLSKKIFKNRPAAAGVTASLIGAVIMVTGYTLGRTFIYGTGGSIAANWAISLVKLPYEILQAGLGVVFGNLLVYQFGLKKVFEKHTHGRSVAAVAHNA